MKKRGFARGAIWTLSIIVILIIIMAVVGVVAYNGYKEASLKATYSTGKSKTTINIEKKDKNSEVFIGEGEQAKIITNYKIIEYQDGRYLGQVNKDGRPHGQGTITWTSGASYNGEWQNGIRTGYGTYTWSNGDKYVGEYKDGIRHGQGTYTDKDGSTYVGEYKNGEKHGQGTWTWKLGEYVGRWKDNKPHGQGTYTWSDGDKYVGEYKDGLRHGQGTWTLANGNKYVGKFKDNKYHGQGTHTYADGRKYVGEHKDGLRHGQGTHTWSDGEKYVGEFKNDVKHGQGTFTHANGKKYVGEYKNDERNGQGTFTWTNGDKHVGEYKDGIRHGQGTYIASDGNKWVGEFKDDKPYGQGTWTDKDGRTYVAEFEEGLNNQKNTTYSTDEKYYALVIGNNNYQYLQKLDAAENDAKVLADVLENNYGFEVTLLLNADYDTTVNSMYAISRKLTKENNLLIFYAGHGELDKKENEGYWLPVDASYENRSKWISNSFVSGQAKATDAKHVLLIVDSCFSGSLMRSVTKTKIYSNEELDDEKYIKKLLKKKTRLVISSGGNEPVMDNDGGEHSYFALKLIETLKNNKGVLNTQMIFENIRKYVVSNTDQTPERKVLHKTGDDGGDFLFFSNLN